ncbi:piwi domain-containing protein [Ditylenchus destructor]|uniref:Piwi domain-containing protein n=1 Tax=Ditylenchus destructor TaxID=166010 RepID=A0AAD4R008_9BILA|nr:piwi domain-containing protein [Ditylenchus destructor]
MAQPNQPLRTGTRLEKEAEKLLADEGIPKGNAIMATKKAPGTINSKVVATALSTNIYGLKAKIGHVAISLYDVKICGVFNSGAEAEFTKTIRGDAMVVDRRDKCRDVFSAFERENAALLNGAVLYYDLQSTLYSTKPLRIRGEQKFVIGREQLPQDFEAPFNHCVLTLKHVKDDVQGRWAVPQANDTTSLDTVDKTFQQFLNIASSQQIMFDHQAPDEKHITFSTSRSYMMNPQHYGFREDDTPPFTDNGSYLAIGAHKGVHYIEGPVGPGNSAPALVIEAKKTPFHVPGETALDKARYVVRDPTRMPQNGDHDKMLKMLKGLQFETHYGEQVRSHKVVGISRFSPRQKQMDLDGEMVTIEEYLRRRYNLTLQFPDAVMIEALGRDREKSFFPLEVCIISDNQRVKGLQQTPMQVQQMIKKCAAPPAIQRRHTDIVKDSLHLSNSNYLQQSGVEFVSQHLNVKARELPAATLQFASNFQSKPKPDVLTWQGRQFIIPAQINKWSAYLFGGSARDSLREDQYRQFLRRYVDEARSRGIAMPEPALVKIGTNDWEKLRDEIVSAANDGVEFALIVHLDREDEMHRLKLGTVRNVLERGQPQTVQNIVQKTNIKLGGLNYSLSLGDMATKEIVASETLFVGLGMAHPAGGLGMGGENGENGNGHGNGHANRNGNGSHEPSSDHGSNGNGSTSDKISNGPPSVIGFCANTGKNNRFEFIGDFKYQVARRDEKTDIIRNIIKLCADNYKLSNDTFPKRVIIYRNGCSEGQFPAVLKYEIPLIRNALEKIGCDARVTLIVSNKLQNVRFFAAQINPGAKPPEQNIKPGTIVDTMAVHPTYVEFFLNSHRAIQGTARTPKYTVLYDDNGLTMDQLQSMTYHLCFGHQIVYLPTSLPSPVYIAELYAKRGYNLYSRWIETVSPEQVQNHTYSTLSQELSYELTQFLKALRVNA